MQVKFFIEFSCKLSFENTVLQPYIYNPLQKKNN